MIRNVDQRSKDYGDIKDKFRPGHADYTYWAKYGIRDYRGGGRSSARETAMRVAAGARRAQGASPASPSAARWCRSATCPSTARCGTGTRSTPTRSSAPMPRPPSPGPTTSTSVRKSGSSIGAVIEVVAEGVPAGWGAPIYGKLDQDLAVGDDEHQRGEGRRDRRRHGRRRAHGRGERRRDPHRATTASRASCRTTPAASSAASPPGQPIVCRFAVKPTSSILTPRKTIDQRRQRDRHRHQGPPRPVRRHPRGADRRSDDGDRAGRSFPAPPRASAADRRIAAAPS